MGFFVGWKRGERKRALGGRGIFMARGTHSAIIEKLLRKRLE
jgi:hypothetical protein